MASALKCIATLGFIITLFIQFSCRDSSEENAQHLSDLKSAVQIFNEAFKNGDVTVLSKLVTDHYVHTNGTSAPINKEVWLSYLASRHRALEDSSLIIREYHMTDASYQVFGSSAVVTGRIEVSGLKENIPFTDAYRVTHHWVFEEGSWKRAAFQDAPIFKIMGESTKTTGDLGFLVGKWSISRTYTPEGEEPRMIRGSLVCKPGLDHAFIHCTYEMQRPGKIRAIDEVYFNYNSIYDNYESIWMSSTWPVKVLLQGSLDTSGNEMHLLTEASFEIENDITEFVRDELIFNPLDSSFTRKTYIRTDEDASNTWTYWMLEKAQLKQ